MNEVGKAGQMACSVFLQTVSMLVKRGRRVNWTDIEGAVVGFVEVVCQSVGANGDISHEQARQIIIHALQMNAMIDAHHQKETRELN